MELSSKKKRGAKTTKEQKKIIVDFLSENKDLITGKCHPLKLSEHEEKWAYFTAILNNAPGARKDKNQWKQFLSEWKCKVKKRARELKSEIKSTGGGGSNLEALDDIENRLMSLIGWISIQGCANLPQELDPEDDVTNIVEVEEIQVDYKDSATEDIPRNIDVSHFLEELPGNDEPNKSFRNMKSPKVGKGKQKITTPRMRRQYHSQNSELVQSSKMLTAANNEMANAMKEMASAVNTIAVSLTELASSIRYISTKINTK